MVRRSRIDRPLQWGIIALPFSIGLAARAASTSLIAVTLVIFIFVHSGEWPDFIIWGFAMIYVVTKGPGEWSIDHYIRRWLLP